MKRKYIVHKEGHQFFKRDGTKFITKEFARADFVVLDLGNENYKIMKNRDGVSGIIITEEDLFAEFL